MKSFQEALKDNFEHQMEFSDIAEIKRYRDEGVRIDEEGIHKHLHGDHKEFELRLEPFGEEGEYLVALYKNGVAIIDKLHVCQKIQK